MSAESVRLLGLLAEPDRLRVVAALVLGARTLGQIREESGLDVRAAAGALARLESGDLVRESGGEYELLAGAFTDAVAAAAPELDDHGASDPTQAQVLRAFLSGGRITAMPSQAGKRQILLEHVVTVFEPGVRYPEREVNAMVRAFHDDHAMSAGRWSTPTCSAAPTASTGVRAAPSTSEGSPSTSSARCGN